jgi:nifR3 family TIM-barrel protein
MRNTDFWDQIPKPIKLLAPMAGYTDSTFREICREQGADVVMTELISADAIYFALRKSRARLQASKTHELMEFKSSEKPLVIQLFGKDPEKFIVASKYIEQDLKADGIDINMGCSVRKVLRSGHGAALLQNEDAAVELVRKLSESTGLPISVKSRLGYDDPTQILTLGPKLAAAGAKVLIIHGRTAKQGFSGEVDWDPIYKLKELLPETIIIGNGDINSYEQIATKLNNLDGVAIGRAALGQPWVFSGRKPSHEELIKLAKSQAASAFESKGRHGIIELRKHLIWYFKGLPNATEIRKELVKVETLEGVNNILDQINII